MVELSTVGFVAGTAVFVLAALGFVAAGVRRGTGTTRKFYATVAVAAGVLAVTYAGMALGVGVRGVGPQGRSAYALRYAGWLVATPLVLVTLWWLAGSDRRTLGGLVGLDVLAVLAAGTAALTRPAVAGLSVRETRLALVGAAALLFVAVVVFVFRVLSPHAGRQPSEVGILFSILRNILALLWILYPVVWIVGVGPELDLDLDLALGFGPGLDLDLRLVLGPVGAGVETVAVFLLDVALVVGIGAILLHDDETLAAAETGRTFLGSGVAKYRAKILAKLRG